MISVYIDDLNTGCIQIIEKFYFENCQMEDAAYREKFEKEFRCKSSLGKTGWLMTFEDDDYTWFLLRYS